MKTISPKAAEVSATCLGIGGPSSRSGAGDGSGLPRLFTSSQPRTRCVDEHHALSTKPGPLYGRGEFALRVLLGA